MARLSTVFALGLIAYLPAIDSRAGGADTTCARDVLVAQSMQRQAIDQLEAAGEDEAGRCRVWRRHVDTMRRLAGVYARCLSGSERKQRLDEVQRSEAEFGGLLRTRCKGL